MKKLIILIFALTLAIPALAWDVKNEAQLQERMNSIGFNILNSNRIEHRLIFRVTNRTYSRDIWADVSSVNGMVKAVYSSVY